MVVHILTVYRNNVLNSKSHSFTQENNDLKLHTLIEPIKYNFNNYDSMLELIFIKSMDMVEKTELSGCNNLTYSQDILENLM